MSDGGAFLVEDFVHSIAAQLDRVQDALRLKAVNRPLTYALKDFALDLHVFPELDEEGHVRFRTAGPNESGASTVRIAFTTITRPMIEENTVSLQASQGPSLEESGLDPEEQRRLEQLGVRNVVQLQKLQKQAGASTIQRLARVPADRLREALTRARPAVDRVAIGPKPVVPPKPIVPTTPKPPPIPVPIPPKVAPPPPKVAAPPIKANPVRVRLEGRNLLGAGTPRVKLDDKLIPIASLDDDAIEVDVPAETRTGALTLELEDGDVHVVPFELPDQDVVDDPWSAGGFG